MEEGLLYIIIPSVKRGTWHSAIEAVKRPIQCPWHRVHLFTHMSLFSQPIPEKLVVITRDSTVVAHSEVRDLGTDPVSHLQIAGLSNTVVAEAFRSKGIYTALIKLRNLIIDCSGFDCVAARVKLGYEERYMAQYPGFRIVKDQDPQGAAWILRETRGKALDTDECASVVSYLEREVEKW